MRNIEQVLIDAAETYLSKMNNNGAVNIRLGIWKYKFDNLNTDVEYSLGVVYEDPDMDVLLKRFDNISDLLFFVRNGVKK